MYYANLRLSSIGSVAPLPLSDAQLRFLVVSQRKLLKWGKKRLTCQLAPQVHRWFMSTSGPHGAGRVASLSLG